jgi:hypothetical protein
MPSPIMLSPNPDLHPIRQELLRWASAGHSSDVETAVPRHGPKNRGSWDPHRQTARAGRLEAGPKVTVAHDAGKESFTLYVWRSLPSPEDQGVAREGLQSNRHQSQLWAVWPKSSTLCFWRGAVATGAGHHRRPLPRPDWSYQQWWRWLWPEESIWLEAVFTSGRATSRCPMRSGEARSSIRPVVVHPTKRADFSRHGYRDAQFEDAFARFLPHESNAIRRGEIVKEIVDHLRPWKDRVSEATVTESRARHSAPIRS